MTVPERIIDIDLGPIIPLLDTVLLSVDRSYVENIHSNNVSFFALHYWIYNGNTHHTRQDKININELFNSLLNFLTKYNLKPYLQPDSEFHNIKSILPVAYQMCLLMSNEELEELDGVNHELYTKCIQYRPIDDDNQLVVNERIVSKNVDKLLESLIKLLFENEPVEIDPNESDSMIIE